jgi:hypothetical protein
MIRCVRALSTILLVASLVFTLPAAAQYECPGAPPSRMIPGQPGQVVPGVGNNLRTEPNTGAERIGLIPGGAFIDVLDGPVCADEYAWWQVSFADLTGWTVEAVGGEYTMEPVERIEYGGVSFLLPIALHGATITPETIPVSDGTEQWTLPHPEYIHFQIEHDLPTAQVSLRQYLEVYPLLAYSRMDSLVADDIHWLRDLLDERPELMPRDPLPYVGARGAAQVLTTQAAYLDTDTIAGIRYLTAYAQASIPIERDTLRYTFQSMTHDGSYYIAFSLPVASHVLPVEFEDFWDSDIFEHYPEYLDEMAAQVNEASPRDFTPRLDALDALIGSIRIDPSTLADAIAAGEQIEVSTEGVHIVEYGACEDTEFPARLEARGAAWQSLPEGHSIFLLDAPGGENVGSSVWEGHIVRIIDGPACANGVNYWLVYRDSPPGAGWIPESGLFHQDQQERYFLQPYIRDEDVPELPAQVVGQVRTPCEVMVFTMSTLYAHPNINSPGVALAAAGMTYYADALLVRREGGFAWWRLTPGATVFRDAAAYNRMEGVVLDETLWIQAQRVNEYGGCADVPVISEP